MSTTEPPEAGHLEHLPTCSTPAVVERETAHRMHLTCTSCGAWTSRPRVTRWGS